MGRSLQASSRAYDKVQVVSQQAGIHHQQQAAVQPKRAHTWGTAAAAHEEAQFAIPICLALPQSKLLECSHCCSVNSTVPAPARFDAILGGWRVLAQEISTRDTHWVAPAAQWLPLLTFSRLLMPLQFRL
jgi:hypothetical protein